MLGHRTVDCFERVNLRIYGERQFNLLIQMDFDAFPMWNCCISFWNGLRTFQNENSSTIWMEWILKCREIKSYYDYHSQMKLTITQLDIKHFYRRYLVTFTGIQICLSIHKHMYVCIYHQQWTFVQFCFILVFMWKSYVSKNQSMFNYKL